MPLIPLLHVALIAVLTMLIAVLWKNASHAAEARKAAERGSFSPSLGKDAHLAMYQSLLRELSQARVQQWTATGYALLIMSVLFGVDRLVFAAPLPVRAAWVLTGVLLLLGCATYLVSVHLLYDLQWRQREHRIGLSKHEYSENGRTVNLLRQSVHWMDEEEFQALVEKHRSFRLDLYARVFLTLVTLGWLLSIFLMALLAPAHV